MSKKFRLNNSVGPGDDPVVFRRLNTMDGTTPMESSAKATTLDEETFRKLVTEASELMRVKDYAEALVKYEEALKLRVENVELLGYTLGSAGLCAFAKGDFEKAVQLHLSHVNTAQRYSNRKMECQATCNMGIALHATGNFQDAIRSFSISLSLAGLLENEQAKMRAYGNLGNTYSAMGDFKKAIENHDHQLRLAQRINDPEAEARASHNLQNDHNSLRRYQLAKTFQPAKEHLYAVRNDESIVLGNFGNNFAHQDTRSGWVLKHIGSGDKEPIKHRKTKKLLVLEDQILAYFADSKSKKAERYINLVEIKAVTKWGGRTFEAEKNFKIKTDKRTFWFTCENSEECNAWLAALSEDLESPVQYEFGGDNTEQQVNDIAKTSAFDQVALPGVDIDRRTDNPAFENSVLDADGTTGEQEFGDSVQRLHSVIDNPIAQLHLQPDETQQQPEEEQDAQQLFTNKAYEDVEENSVLSMLRVTPQGHYHVEADEDEESLKPSSRDVLRGYAEFIGEIEPDAFQPQYLLVEDRTINLKPNLGSSSVSLSLKMAEICSVEVSDSCIILVTRNPPFDAHVFECSSKDIAKQVRVALCLKLDQAKQSGYAEPQDSVVRKTVDGFNVYDTPSSVVAQEAPTYSVVSKERSPKHKDEVQYADLALNNAMYSTVDRSRNRPSAADSNNEDEVDYSSIAYAEIQPELSQSHGYLTVDDNNNNDDEVSPYATQAQMSAMAYPDLPEPGDYSNDIKEPIHDVVRREEDEISPYATQAQMVAMTYPDILVRGDYSQDVQEPIHDVVRIDEDPTTGEISPYATRQDVQRMRIDNLPAPGDYSNDVKEPIHDFVRIDEDPDTGQINPYATRSQAAILGPASAYQTESHYATTTAQTQYTNEPIFDFRASAEAQETTRARHYEDVSLLMKGPNKADSNEISPPRQRTETDPEELHGFQRVRLETNADEFTGFASTYKPAAKSDNLQESHEDYSQSNDITGFGNDHDDHNGGYGNGNANYHEDHGYDEFGGEKNIVNQLYDNTDYGGGGVNEDNFGSGQSHNNDDYRQKESEQQTQSSLDMW